jgi:uncharacterized protein (DUF736 family)
MIIGRFAANPKTGVMIGHVRTLFFRSDKVIFEPIAEPTERGPSHRIWSGDEVELGAAWRRTAHSDGHTYYSVKLDDPTFAAPINANLVSARDDTGHILIWERSSTKAA